MGKITANLRSLSMNDLVPLIRETVAQNQDFYLFPRGISMLPMLRQEKDSVCLSAVKGPLKKYDIPLYRRDDGAYILHRIVKTGETYTCIGDNQYALEAGVRPDQIIAVVTSFTRGGKVIPVTNIGYGIYCRLWHWSRPLRRFCGRVIRKLKRIFR